jgi:hypothetical protein
MTEGDTFLPKLEGLASREVRAMGEDPAREEWLVLLAGAGETFP